LIGLLNSISGPRHECANKNTKQSVEFVHVRLQAKAFFLVATHERFGPHKSLAGNKA
jgi:hypothetical protein